MVSNDRPWIEKEELEDVKVKWGWSHFAGLEDGMNAKGDHNFIVILPEPLALDLLDKGWTGIRQLDPMEEGDTGEWIMKIRISDKFGMPKVFFIKNERKFRIDKMSELADIRRDVTEQIDVVVTPSFWEQPGRSGVSAYAEELYVTIKTSRFDSKYQDFEEA